MCYCPGCSHGGVLEHLGTALDRLRVAREQVCIVSDIGCIGTADRYFDCHTFHGLHGRSLTYAEGIRRVRPDALVIVLIGDGGCGIGTAHLVHAARRGIGIKVIVCNNFNFGMTGGQHSPTTPTDFITSTTPGGFGERPFDICGTVIANGADHVARCSALDAACVDYIEAALRSPGFALLDIWELCTAYFVPANRLKPQTLSELSASLNLPFGLLREVKPVTARRPAAGTDAAARMGKRTAPEAEQEERFSHQQDARLALGGRREICIAGSAGQHIRSAAGVIGELAVAGGLFAAQLDDFPITVRKGHSVSNLILADRPIRYSGMDEPDIVLVLSPDGLARLGPLDHLKPACRIYADERLFFPQARAGITCVSVEQVGRQTGRSTAALALLVRALVESGALDGTALIAIAEQALKDKYRTDNLRAIRWGARAVDSEAPVDVASSLDPTGVRP